MFSFITGRSGQRDVAVEDEKNYILLSAKGVSALNAEYEQLERDAADLYQENLVAAEEYEVAVAKALEEYRNKMVTIAKKVTAVTEKQSICFEAIKRLGVSVTV